MAMTEEGHLSLTEAARRLGVPAAALRRWVGEGLVRAEPGPAGRPRFAPSEVERARAALGFRPPDGGHT